jgi:TM2 domain-containing membrane protein YozV
MPFCSNCGKEIPAGSAFCTSCGTPVQAGGQPAPMPGTFPQAGPGPQGARKSMLVALILSFILPGLGQYYAGQTRKGRNYIIIAIILFLTILLEIGIILYPIFWLYSMVDTFLTVRKANSGSILN